MNTIELTITIPKLSGKKEYTMKFDGDIEDAWHSLSVDGVENIGNLDQSHDLNLWTDEETKVIRCNVSKLIQNENGDIVNDDACIKCRIISLSCSDELIRHGKNGSWYWKGTKPDKKEVIRKHTERMIDDITSSMKEKINRAIRSGAIDVSSYDPDINPYIVPTSIVNALLIDATKQLPFTGTAFENEIKRDAKNIYACM